jgi:transcriptional regulator with XRE-family HTH domain
MSNLGQQLQEARSRLGYSLKEVADIIHIRPEYLGEMEENSFNIPLPTVYVRGFVRLYSKFLKLNQDEMVELFNKRNAQIEFSSEVTAERETLRQGRSLGQFTLPHADRGEEGIERSGGSRIFERYRASTEDHRSPWIYVAGIGAAVILTFAVIFSVRLFLFPTETDPPTSDPLLSDSQLPGQSSTSAAPSGARPAAAVESLRDELIGLVAKAPVYVYVTQTQDREILYSGRLESGERKTLIREGEISIACDRAENLIVEKGGIPVDLKGATGKVQFLID